MRLLLWIGVPSLHRTPITHSDKAKVNPQVMMIQNHPLTVKVRVQVSREARVNVTLSAIVAVSLQAIHLKNFIHTILKT
jgi:hypothetical protein